jgi:Glycosyl hydrolase family 63 C-terminal domain
VPSEFVAQRPNTANPPTLFLALADLARQVAASRPITYHEAAQLDEELRFLSTGWASHPAFSLLSGPSASSRCSGWEW